MYWIDKDCCIFILLSREILFVIHIITIAIIIAHDYRKPRTRDRQKRVLGLLILARIPMQHCSSKHNEAHIFENHASKPCHVDIRWKALAECCQISTHVSGVLHHFLLAKLATTSIF